MAATALYRIHELSIRTLYAEVKERAIAAGQLLPGTPGTLVKRDGTGPAYWYRSYYPVPKKRVEDLIGPVADEAAHRSMLERVELAQWIAHQVGSLSKLGYQVADKGVASVLVELHNKGLFEAGLVMVGTLAYMSWLNELGAIAVAARTQDIDLARRQTLVLAAPVKFFESMQATQLPFARIPGLPSHHPSTSVKLPGIEGVRVDVLAPGTRIGGLMEVPELSWHAQTIPHYDYLLDDSRSAAVLAGGHCVPGKLPDASRLVWHKLYSSADRSRDTGKAEKDLVQAATLAAILAEQGNGSLRETYLLAPGAVKSAAAHRVPRLRTLLAGHPQALDIVQELTAKRRPPTRTGKNAKGR
jgi:hypothetical protein